MHEENKRLYRARQAKQSAFHFISMDDLIAIVECSLTRDNVVMALGGPLRQCGAIAVVGPPSADWHCVQICKKEQLSILHGMGDMSVASARILPRCNPVVI